MSIPTLQILALKQAKILGSSQDFQKSLGKWFPGFTSDQIKERLIDHFNLNKRGNPIFSNNTFRLHPWQTFARERVIFNSHLRDELYRARLGNMSNFVNQLKLVLIRRDFPEWTNDMYECMK